MVLTRRDRPEISLDIEAPEYAASWEAEGRKLRSSCPMAWSTRHGGHWVASSYKDIVRIAQDDAAFTTAKAFDPETGHVDGGVAIPPMPVARLVPAETARPEWDGFRGLLNPRLGPRATEGHRERARGYAAALIDQVIETGGMDSVQDFTNPLTGMVTLDVLGIPLEEWRLFSTTFHALTSLNKSDPAYPAAVAQAGVMDKRIDEEIERHRQSPGDGLISHLVTAEIDGKPVAHEDIHQMIFNVVAGGVDTTTALTSNVLVHLWQHKDQRKKLLDDRSLIPTAREEFIRYFSPLHGSARTALGGATIGEQDIEAGERIFLLLAAANRDPDVFENPDEVQLDRYPNRHIGFSAGIHRCVGSFLARMMFEVMIEQVLDRLPDYEVDLGRARRYPSVSPVNGWVNIPLSFTPGQRSGQPAPEWLERSL